METKPAWDSSHGDDLTNETLAERCADNPSRETVLAGLLEQREAKLASVRDELYGVINDLGNVFGRDQSDAAALRKSREQLAELVRKCA